MNSDREPRGRGEERPKQSGPRPPIDVTGPRLPRLVQAVTAARCYSCSTMLPPGTNFNGNCPKCNAELHCCKQCSQFEPSTRFQCLKPIPVRIPVKDKANDCAFFSARVTVARDAPAGMQQPNRDRSSQPLAEVPRNSSDARDAFDRLFKKES
ncbi:MAG TPA: hypothetical protein VL285_16535 [Bryobacteraceae bacterium]|jgi:hypothetical protein|nr:hypothetical protein [Bryobacteraceae bacterium]